jgi:hypothetical protein
MKASVAADLGILHVLSKMMLGYSGSCHSIDEFMLAVYKTPNFLFFPLGRDCLIDDCLRVEVM